MPSLLQRLLTTKHALLATAFTAAGVVALVIARRHVSLAEIGLMLLGAGMLSVVFELYVARDADERLAEVIDQKLPRLRDSVVEGLAAEPERILSIASPRTIDSVVKNCIAAQVGDRALAADIHKALKWQISEIVEPVRHESQITITLTPWGGPPRIGRGSLFFVTVRCSYRTHTLPHLLRFSAVTDPEIYGQLLRDPASLEACLLDPVPPGREVDVEEFDLLKCVINGRSQTIQRTDDDVERFFSVVHGETIRPDEQFDVTYVYRRVVPQHGHRLFIDVGTARGLRVDFNYGPECDIQHVDTFPYTPGPTQPLADDSIPGTISIDFGTAWTLPRSGVVFSWMLNRELFPSD